MAKLNSDSIKEIISIINHFVNCVQTGKYGGDEIDIEALREDWKECYEDVINILD